MFVTAQDFQTIPYKVPTALTTQPDGTVVANPDFDAFIVKEEKKIILNILGGSFYEAFVDGLDALPDEWTQTITPDGYSIDDTVTQDELVFKSLINDNILPTTDDTAWVEVPNIWLQLKNGDNYLYLNRKYFWLGMKDLLVSKIFSLWLTDTYDNYTQFGITIPQVENAQLVNPSRRIVNGNNEFVNKLGNYYKQKDTLYGYIYQKNIEDARFAGVYDPDLFASLGSYLQPGFCKYGTMNIFNI